METRLNVPLSKAGLSVAVREQAGRDGGQKIKFVNPNTDNYEPNIRSCAARGLPMARKDSLTATTAVVCGSGPSLKDPEVLESIRDEVAKGAVVYACKAAIKYLHDAGLPVDYGVSMDPGAHIADPRKIAKVPGVVHMIASTSDPALFDYLLGNEWGGPAMVNVFHSATGFQRVLSFDDPEWKAITDMSGWFEREEDGKKLHVLTEESLYRALFEHGDVMTGGFNVVNRAVSLARYMGADRIVLAGADSGWRGGDEMYCDGPEHRPGVDMSDHGVVDGVPWHTRPDMLASAVSLAKLAIAAGSEDFVILGDTLPASLSRKDPEFLDKVASF